MDSDLLERAKLLQAAAGDMINLQKSIRVSENVATSSYSPSRSSPKRHPQGFSSAETLRGSAIRGSSLLTTFQDIRQHCPRGATIVIDGVSCTVSGKGEYSASQISLAEDFKGESNFDCVINVAAGESSRVRTRIRAVAPIPSCEIFDAIRNLDDIGMIKTQMAQRAASKKDMPFQKGAPGRAQSLLKRMQYRPAQSGTDDDAPSRKLSKFKSRLPMAVRQASAYSDYDGANRASSAPSRDEPLPQQQSIHGSNSSVVSSGHRSVSNATRRYRGGEQPTYSYEEGEEVLRLGSRDVVREREKALQRVAQKLREDREKIKQV